MGCSAHGRGTGQGSGCGMQLRLCEFRMGREGKREDGHGVYTVRFICDTVPAVMRVWQLMRVIAAKVKVYGFKL